MMLDWMLFVGAFSRQRGMTSTSAACPKPVSLLDEALPVSKTLLVAAFSLLNHALFGAFADKTQPT
jgi:hypothetical protein